ncbi:MAG: hypothetical protein PVJ39_18245 [Gammaproteobacteria bacterium]|jgi:hypothetical protein
MMDKGQCRALIGYVLVFLFTAVVAGCGGGGSDTGSGGGGGNTNTPVAASVDITAIPNNIIDAHVGEPITLDGTQSTVSTQDPLSFEWSMVAKPDGSAAQLQSATSAQPTFTPDAAGTYKALMVVSAGGSSTHATATVIVTNTGTPPHIHNGLNFHCVQCHTSDKNFPPGKSPDHIATTNACETCHTTFGFTVIPRVDHDEVFGNCSECHNGVIAKGKSEFHVPTTQECDNCHNTTSFLDLQTDGTFDHTGITTGCARCHDGVIATGKQGVPNHPDTTSDCSNCHTTDTFVGGFPDHRGPDVVGHQCSECHNPSGPGIGKPTDGSHPDTTVDCGVCHNIRSFVIDVFDHSVVDSNIQTCSSCHDGTIATGKQGVPNHPDTQSDCGNCHHTDAFTPQFVDHTGPDVVGNRCDSCHDGSTDARSIQPADHHMDLPAGSDCGDCHTPGTFSSGTYDHAGVVDNCASCHDGVIAMGKISTHLPTTQDCSVCHNTTDFADATFDHTGIVDGCSDCHNGNISIGKPSNHVPTTDDCSVCHESTSDFSQTTRFTSSVHPTITSDCVSCHSPRVLLEATPDANRPLVKPANHIPAQDNCGDCHNYNDGFASPAKFLSNVHLNITRGCEGCHKDRFLGTGFIKAQDHLPTAQDCYYCHAASAGDFTTTPNFNHTDITGNCESCHDGSFAALGARGKTASPPHPVTTQDCGVCHNTTDFAAAYVDHTSPDVLSQRCDNCHNGTRATGKTPDHVPTTEDCGLCHTAGGSFANAVFDHTGIVDNCASCHDGVQATGLSPNHVSILDSNGNPRDCSVCHNTTAFAGATFDHTGIVDNCASCHNGTTATGKNPTHVPTNQDCSVCHQTTGFLPAIFDHTGIVDNCASCHDGVSATGKPSGHIQTTQDCGVCHTTDTFVGAVFDHTGIVDNCASCHDGNTATGKPPTHLPTTLDCHNCHTTATFVGGTWDHQGITGNCVSCHDGTTATGKGRDHFVTTEDCNACHSTTGWTPIVNFQHTTNDYPGDHNSRVTCASCHTNNSATISSYESSRYTGTCAACHERDYAPGEHRGTLADNANCQGSRCHDVGDRSF